VTCGGVVCATGAVVEVVVVVVTLVVVWDVCPPCATISVYVGARVVLGRRNLAFLIE